MRSLVKLYDMYKAGEYIPDFNNDKMRYMKVLDLIPDGIRKELIRLDDKIGKRNSIIFGSLLLLYFILGLILGCVIYSSVFIWG